VTKSMPCDFGVGFESKFYVLEAPYHSVLSELSLKCLVVDIFDYEKLSATSLVTNGCFAMK